ncbi:MAG: hypothetical protein K0M78_05255, partial [Brevundimonas sp.]|nr:hypothetical protein [Brevundimonas sp.]
MRILLFALAPALAAGPALAQIPAGPDPAAIIAEAKAVCEADGGALWGVDLCTPILLVDPATRTIHAGQRGESDALKPEGALFVGALPDTVNIANTALEWDGVRWAMVMRPLPDEPTRRRALLAHESWHGVQERLGLPAASPTPEHLSTTESRVLMRLEWRGVWAAPGAAAGARRAHAGPPPPAKPPGP